MKKFYSDVNFIGDLSFGIRGDISISGTINNQNTDNISVIYFSGNNPTVTGFINQNIDNEKILFVSFIGTGVFTLSSESPLSAANNRLSLATSTFTFLPNQNCILIYDTNILRWRLYGTSATSSFSYTPENVANKSTAITLGTSDILYSTQNAVKSYVDTNLNNKQNALVSGINIKTINNQNITGSGNLSIGKIDFIWIPDKPNNLLNFGEYNDLNLLIQDLKTHPIEKKKFFIKLYSSTTQSIELDCVPFDAQNEYMYDYEIEGIDYISLDIQLYSTRSEYLTLFKKIKNFNLFIRGQCWITNTRNIFEFENCNIQLFDSAVNPINTVSNVGGLFKLSNSFNNELFLNIKNTSINCTISESLLDVTDQSFSPFNMNVVIFYGACTLPDDFCNRLTTSPNIVNLYLKVLDGNDSTKLDSYYEFKDRNFIGLQSNLNVYLNDLRNNGTSFTVEILNVEYKIGQSIYFDGNNWQLAIANNIKTIATGIIKAIPSYGTYQIAFGGEIELNDWTNLIGTTNLTPGETYFVSDTTAGQYKTLSPAISNPMLRAISTTRAIIQPGFQASSNGVGESIVEDFSTLSASGNTFTLSSAPLGKAYTWVNINGIQEQSSAFSISGNVINFTNTYPAGTFISVRYVRTFRLDTRNNILRFRFVATAGQTQFSLPITPESVDYIIAFIDGAWQNKASDGGSYSLTNGNMLTFDTPLTAGQVVSGIIINAVNFDVDVNNYITRRTTSLANGSNILISNSALFNSNLSGEYRIKVQSNPTISARCWLKATAPSDLDVFTISPSVTNTFGNSGTLNIDLNSDTIRIQNLTGSPVDLVVVREL